MIIFALKKALSCLIAIPQIYDILLVFKNKLSKDYLLDIKEITFPNFFIYQSFAKKVDSHQLIQSINIIRLMLLNLALIQSLVQINGFQEKTPIYWKCQTRGKKAKTEIFNLDNYFPCLFLREDWLIQLNFAWKISRNN
ncbi:hypothetical protein ABPG72_020182 [Tetrahymena utriculariae]